MINVGDTNISGVYIGDEELSVYIGDELIYPLNFGTLTAITLDDLTWVTDISWEGGTGTSANCSYIVTGHYDSGKTRKLNRYAVVDGEITASSTTSQTRDLVGTLVLTTTCSGLSATGSVQAYQEKYNPIVWVPLSSITNTVPVDAIAWVTSYSASGDRWLSEVSGLNTSNYSWSSSYQTDDFTGGWWGHHRWNYWLGRSVYAWTFTGTVIDFDTTYYGDAVKDGPFTSLTRDTITVDGNNVDVYVLDFREWNNWKPLYGAYSDPTRYFAGTYVRLYNG